MRALILGNMANDGYAVAKQLRKMNADVDLAINISDFGMALPEWEDGIFNDNADPYDLKKNEIKKSWNAPSWIHYFDFQNKVPRKKHRIEKLKARINLIKLIREYDVVEAQVPYSMYTQFSGIPYVTHDAGWIRYFPFEGGIRNRLARRGYKKAKKVIMTNPDTFEISDNLPYIKKDKVCFIPFAIDPEKYKPVNANELRSQYVKNSDQVLLFCPARQMWKEKGNDKMIRAYSKFTKDFPNSKFIMVEWSEDEENSKKLLNSLGLSEHIVWIKPVPKNRLIEYYNAADIVLDQFVLGSWGTATPEAMSCGKPVLMFYKKEFIMRAFGEEPPIINSFTEEEICSNLIKLAKNPEFRNEIGQKSREWVKKTHSPQKVAEEHLKVLESVLE